MSNPITGCITSRIGRDGMERLRPMGQIVELPAIKHREDLNRSELAGSAEVIIFPGVRIERQDGAASPEKGNVSQNARLAASRKDRR